MDEPFDFDSDMLLTSPPVQATKKRKVIGLDDLLADHYKEKSKLIEKESKRAKTKKTYNSDDEEDGRVATLCKFVDECQEKMGQLCDEEDISLWGLHVFGKQKVPPTLVPTELASCVLVNSFMNHELNSLVELNMERGETFLEGLLANGWLLKSVHACNHVDKFIAAWTFNLMLYSSKEVLRTAACDFWCAILLLKNEGDSLPMKIDWLPNYSEMKGALESYGFLLDSPTKYLSNVEMANGESECMGPPQNIRGWIKYVAACSQTRNRHLIFSTTEAEELVAMIICLFLDRQLLGLSVILHECLLSLVSFFTYDEWSSSSENVAKSIACRVPLDINCLRTVDSISGVCARSKHLRSAIAFQILLSCFDDKVDDDAEEVLRLLISINVKDKSCDLFKMYIYLVLTENWLLSNTLLEDKPLISEMWGVLLRNCSCHITNTDTRSYAPKVRSKASYLLQGTINK